MPGIGKEKLDDAIRIFLDLNVENKRTAWLLITMMRGKKMASQADRLLALIEAGRNMNSKEFNSFCKAIEIPTAIDVVLHRSSSNY